MERELASEVQKHLMEANAAVDRAASVAVHFDTEDRKIFVRLLRGFYFECDEVLERIYFNFPDLRPAPPPQEPPEISSELRWADVVLPSSVTAADLDKIIFSKLGKRLMKTARIIYDVMVECQRLAWPITQDIVGARLEELSDDDRIDTAGDLRYWGNSEIRLKPDESDQI
jgi:hypothetical protein